MYTGNVVELVDTTDLKSVAVKGVRVQVPPFPIIYLKINFLVKIKIKFSNYNEDLFYS